MKTLLLFASLLFASVAIAAAESVKAATTCAGAAKLDNGSMITIGQPIVGRIAAQDSSVSFSSGLLPALLSEPEATNRLVSIKTQLLADGRFSFSFSAPPGRNYVVQASTNLTSWSTISTNLSTWTGVVFEDEKFWMYPLRFYRVIAPSD